MVAPYSNSRIARSMVRVPGSGPDEKANLICLNLGNVSPFAAMIPVPQSVSFSGRNGRQIMRSTSFGPSTKPIAPEEIASLQAAGVMPSASEEMRSLQEPKVVESEPSHEFQTSLPSSENPRIVRPQLATSDIPSALPSGGSNIQRSSTQKRPMRQESREEISHNVPSKRARDSTAQRQNIRSDRPIWGSTNIAANWALPQGMSGTTVSVPTVPVLFPVVNPTNTQIAIPLGCIQTEGVNPTAVFMQGIPSQTQVYQSVSSLPTAAGTKCSMDHVLRERDNLRRENQALKYRLSRFQALLRNKPKLITVLKQMDVTSA